MFICEEHSLAENMKIRESNTTFVHSLVVINWKPRFNSLVRGGEYYICAIYATKFNATSLSSYFFHSHNLHKIEFIIMTQPHEIKSS